MTCGNYSACLLLGLSLACARPCFDLPKGVERQPPGSSTAVIVVATPTPIVFSPIAKWRALSPAEIRETSEELASLLSDRLVQGGVQARAIHGTEPAVLRYDDRGVYCSTPAEAEAIRNYAAEKARELGVESVLAIRFMVHLTQVISYSAVPGGTVKQSVEDSSGRLPMVFCGYGVAHLVDRNGRHLHYELMPERKGLQISADRKTKILDRREWLDEIAGTILQALPKSTRPQ